MNLTSCRLWPRRGSEMCSWKMKFQLGKLESGLLAIIWWGREMTRMLVKMTMEEWLSNRSKRKLKTLSTNLKISYSRQEQICFLPSWQLATKTSRLKILRLKTNNQLRKWANSWQTVVTSRKVLKIWDNNLGLYRVKNLSWARWSETEKVRWRHLSTWVISSMATSHLPLEICLTSTRISKLSPTTPTNSNI